MEPKQKRIIIDGIVLAIPFVGIFSWFAYLVISAKPEGYTGALSPGKLDSLVTFLFAFIMLYGIFLVYKFRQLKKEAKK